MEAIIKIVNSLQEYGLLIKIVGKVNEEIKQKGDFLECYQIC